MSGPSTAGPDAGQYAQLAPVQPLVTTRRSKQCGTPEPLDDVVEVSVIAHIDMVPAEPPLGAHVLLLVSQTRSPGQSASLAQEGPPDDVELASGHVVDV